MWSLANVVPLARLKNSLKWGTSFVFLVELSVWSSWTSGSCCNNFFNTTASAGPQKINSTWVIHHQVTFKWMGSYSRKKEAMTAQFKDRLWPLWCHAVLSVYLLSFTHMSHIHPSVHRVRVLWSFTSTGRVLFPQVCLSWHFDCEPVPLLDTLYIRVGQNQQQEEMRKGRLREKRKHLSYIKPSSGSCSGVKTQRSAECEFKSVSCEPASLRWDVIWLRAVKTFVTTLALNYHL